MKPFYPTAKAGGFYGLLLENNILTLTGYQDQFILQVSLRVALTYEELRTVALFYVRE